MQVLAYVNRVRDVVSDVDHASFTQEDVEANDVRCPDAAAAQLMYKGARLLLLDDMPDRSATQGL
jgi:hypothetical protein